MVVVSENLNTLEDLVSANAKIIGESFGGRYFIKLLFDPRYGESNKNINSGLIILKNDANLKDYNLDDCTKITLYDTKRNKLRYDNKEKIFTKTSTTNYTINAPTDNDTLMDFVGKNMEVFSRYFTDGKFWSHSFCDGNNDDDDKIYGDNVDIIKSQIAIGDTITVVNNLSLDACCRITFFNKYTKLRYWVDRN